MEDPESRLQGVDLGSYVVGILSHEMMMRKRRKRWRISSPDCRE